MTVRVFIENEAGSKLKNYHDEKTLTFRGSRQVLHAYPLPYGFIIGTDARDGCNVDCFVVTDRTLRTGDIVECEVIGLMEQFEDGIEDHNVLARPVNEAASVTPAIRDALVAHVLSFLSGIDQTTRTVGRFLGAADGESHVRAHAEVAAG